jgi:divalent metal cation (Fe/Co/Zn/Cd) transporter
MITTLQIPDQSLLCRVRRVQALTILWMSVEAGVALAAAWMARSPAMLAFGGDSAVELFSAVVVLWAFGGRSNWRDAEAQAARIAGILLLLLAIYVAVVAAKALFGHAEPRPTYVGLAILVAAAVIMPWLAREKRALSGAMGSAALRADAAESALCAYLSLIALAGVALNAAWRIWWADPLAALFILPLVIWEARQALRGQACGCC